MGLGREESDMDCPRCDGTLEELVFEGRRAVVCESCGFADVAADHSPAERENEESWETALRRFLER
ncbi:hypothetical protein [Halarchaeum sp. P4]|uniref:hypothetical protein n=1 Tax=Halarchaeum sp. P4 TaxID=3421639 RepID=UPI003EB78256